MRLTSLEMREALGDFTDAATRALDYVKVHDESYREVLQWIESVKGYNLHCIFRPDIVNEVMSSFLMKEAVRNFIFDVQFRFYAISGNGGNFLDRLCQTLEDALIIDGPVKDYSVLDEALSSSFPLTFLKGSKRSSSRLVNWYRKFFSSSVGVAEFLRSNPIFVVVILTSIVNEELNPREKAPAQ